jgi:7-keto-8-aminopelargonate synthetase-like enzyme
MARYLINAARTLSFSTALPPPAVAGALAALELLEAGPKRVSKLAANAAALRAELQQEGFDLGGSRTQILPLVVGDAELTRRISEAALARGVFTETVRPPTVRPMTSRLRLTVMATHREEELRTAARTLAEAAREAGVPPSQLSAPVGEAPSAMQPPPQPVASVRGESVGVFDFEAPERIRRAA